MLFSTNLAWVLKGIYSLPVTASNTILFCEKNKKENKKYIYFNKEGVSRNAISSYLLKGTIENVMIFP